MFFILSKTLYFLVMPSVWLVVLAALSLFLKSEKRKKQARVILFVFLILLTSPFLSNEAVLLWEVAPKTYDDTENHKVGIVLTGVVNTDKKPSDRVHFMDGADRIMHAVELYKKGKIQKILISGITSITITGKKGHEAKGMPHIAKLCNVPADDILRDSVSKNTRENALLASELLRKKGYKPEDCLLITSGFHMRRARACFAKAGFPAEDFSAHFYAYERKTDFLQFVPSASAFRKWEILTRELLGYGVYTVMGYL